MMMLWDHDGRDERVCECVDDSGGNLAIALDFYSHVGFIVFLLTPAVT